MCIGSQGQVRGGGGGGGRGLNLLFSKIKITCVNLFGFICLISPSAYVGLLWSAKSKKKLLSLS